MQAQLREISSDEVDVKSYAPNSSDAFCITLNLKIGAEGESGADNFAVYVCNLKWLERHAKMPFLASETIIVNVYDYERIKSVIVESVAKCSGGSWGVVGNSLSRYFSWEFSDYRG